MIKWMRLPVCLLLFIIIQQDSNAQQTNDAMQTITYRIAGKDTLKAFVFRPAANGKPHPAILLFHGGAWQLGDATWTNDRAKKFAEKGIVAFSIDYRLANNGKTPIEGVEDACAAFEWVRHHAKEFDIDIKRVAGYGVSAGGHLVAAAGTIPSANGRKIESNARPDAMLLYSPALNMAHDPYFVRLIGTKGNPAEYSPSEYITKNLPPTLIIQGEQDSIVYTPDAKAFRDAAIKAGANCKLYIYPGVGHLLTRNIKVQYKDFDSDPKFVEDAFQKENEFLQSIGYISK